MFETIMPDFETLNLPDLDEFDQYLGKLPDVCVNVPNLSPPRGDHDEESPYIEVAVDQVFRHAMELKGATHGGYIGGHILLPSSVRHNGLIKISPHPAGKSKQILQPNLFHVTIMNSTKKSIWKPHLTKRNWQVLIRMKEGEAFLLVWSEDHYEEKLLNCVQDGKKIILGGSGLLLTAITPLQSRKRGDLDGLATFKRQHDEVPIRAVFILERDGKVMHVEQRYPGFRQIAVDKDNFEIHQNTITFKVPGQDLSVIRSIDRNKDTVKVALFRPHDERYSLTKFNFQFIAHLDGECNFCAIMQPSHSGGIRASTRARRDHRRRVTNSGETSSCYSPASSGIYSPGSSSSFADDWSPNPKRQRQSSGCGSSDEHLALSPLAHPGTLSSIEVPNFTLTMSPAEVPATESEILIEMTDLFNCVPSIMATSAPMDLDSLISSAISSSPLPLIPSQPAPVQRFFNTQFDCQDCAGSLKEEDEKGFNSISLPTEAELFDEICSNPEGSRNVPEDLSHSMAELELREGPKEPPKARQTQKKLNWLNMVLPVLMATS
eukprot:maker-scaffold17_size721972-snap-gene-1.20 protein:Tk09955 transcript:maker-scaffold17_size721972-snap-gene-1.20-mRNA-1 annotation:"hypothetical protein"